MKIRSANNFFTLFGAVFFTVGMTFLLVGIFHMISFNSFKSRAVTVPAEITYIDMESARRDSSTHTEVLVSYTVDGRSYESDLGYYSSGMHVGDTVEVFADPADPSEIKADTVLFDVIFIIVGGIFSVIGGCFLAANHAKSAERKRLIREGEQLSAVITSVQINTNVRINGRHPYRADCEYTDPLSGEKYLFRSGNVMADISGMTGCTVTVYADSSDRSRYYVDIDGASQEYSEAYKIHDYR